MRLNKRVLIWCVGLCLAGVGGAYAETHTLTSPDGRIAVSIELDARLRYAVTVDGAPCVTPSPIALRLKDGRIFGKAPKLIKAEESVIDEVLRPVLPEKRAEVPNRCKVLTLRFEGGYGLIARAYDDGAAYRFFTEVDEDLIIEDEEATFAFDGDYTVYHPHCKGYKTSFESDYVKEKLSEFENEELAFAPLLVEVGDTLKVVITEADLDAYPGMFLTGDPRKKTHIVGDFAPYPKTEEQVRDRYLVVKEGEEFIAKTVGRRAFPWRVLAIAREDGALLANDIVYRLGPDCQVADTSWIKAGKVSWDWWNANNLYNVDFRAGVNTDTYKCYIDFAAKNGLEYIILDEGWSDTQDLSALKKVIDLHELIAYGAERNVGLILWCVWLTIDRQWDSLARFEEWGIKGVKVDFMDRDDQKMVEFYHRLAKATADHHLLLDFHGAYKPTGLRRAYPNLITREGVMGLEYSKWSKDVTPEYEVTLPFIRQLAGPMDFTPGAMQNAIKGNFRPIHTDPMSQGTRCHQLGMFVVFECPLQMLCDTPTAYEKEPDCTAFLAAVPSTWDETRVLSAKLADHVLIARRKGAEWYVGALGNWRKHKLSIDFGFLGEGAWQADCYADGLNADRNARDYRRSQEPVTAATTKSIELAPGGGFAARLIKQ